MDVSVLIKKIAMTIKKNVPKNTQIFLFGSFAKGNALPTSDIDIGILGPHQIPFKTMIRIKEELDVLPTLRSVDVVDLQSVSDRFREQALRDAQPL